MKIIKDWLNSGKNFHVGAAIYKTIGKNDNLKALLAKGYSVFAAQSLEKELTDMLQPSKTIIAALPTVTPDFIPESKDKVLEAIRNTWLPKYQRMNYLRHELDKYKGNSPEMILIRKPIVYEVLELEQECMVHWDEADTYLKTGKVPGINRSETMVVPEDPIERAKAIENTKRNIRRNRQEMAKNPDNPRLPALYENYKEFYFRLTGQHYQENSK